MSRPRIGILVLLVFVSTVGIHHLHHRAAAREDCCPGETEGVSCIADTVKESPVLAGYWRGGAGFLGLSYALAFAFLAYVVTISLTRKGGLKPIVAGTALTGAFWLAVCWLAGCCGSPLLPVCVSLLGGTFLGLTGPLVFALTCATVLRVRWFRLSSTATLR